MKASLKKRTMALLTAFLCFTSCLCAAKQEASPVKKGEVVPIASYSLSAVEQSAAEKGFLPVLQNEECTLFYQPDNAEIAVYHRGNDELFYSNPQSVSSEIRGEAYHRILSQLYLTYYVNNSQIKYFSSHFDSVEQGQFSASLRGDQLRVEYVFGKKTYSKDMLPIAIPKEKFEKKIMPALSEEDLDTVTQRYHLLSYASAKSEVARKKYKEQYQNIETTDLYVLDKYLPEYEVETIYQALYSVYTQEDFAEDNRAAGGITDVEDDTVSFTLALVYQLKGDSLSVQLDCSKLERLKNADIDTINVLEFFGCGGQEDEGYSLIPDGCGGIVRFHSDKDFAGTYAGRIYGKDQTVQWETALSEDNELSLPVFGISKNQSGIFAVIGKGAETCRVISKTAGAALPYSFTAVSVNVNPYDKMSILNPEYGGGTTEILVRQKKPYRGTVEIGYHFLKEGKNTFSDMANLYRTLLINEGVLGEKLTGSLPFVCRFVGAVDVQKHFLGIPYTGMQVLTSFSQARSMIDWLKNKGVCAMEIGFDAWCNGGLKQTAFGKVKRLSCLGSQKQMDTLFGMKGVTVYPDVKITEVSPGRFDGFSVRGDAAKLTYNETALLYPISLSRGTPDYSKTYKYILSPCRYKEFLNQFMKKYAYDTLSLSDIVHQINSDFSDAHYAERSKSFTLTKQAVNTLGKHYRIMASRPGAYAFKAIDIMTDTPLTTGGANLFDQEVPFLQMVLSGYKEMATAPINISDGSFSLADLLAFGTLPNFTFSYAPSADMKDTDYSELYSIGFADWKKPALQLFKDYKKVMQELRGHSVVNWEKNNAGLVCVTYDNGVNLIVNQTASDLVYGEETVQANSYIVR